MAYDISQSKEVDLDRTDRLPVLQGIIVEEDVADDSVSLDHSATVPGTLLLANQPALSEFARQTGVDLPSLAESVRSVEERIARQNADYEALNRMYEKARDAQLAAGTRADSLAAELGAAQSALAAEQNRLRDVQQTLADANAAAEVARKSAEESVRESERVQAEARTLRESLAARDASIAQLLHSLGERDAQLSALQREHAKVVPALEARSQTGVRLEKELQTERDRTEALSSDLKATRKSVSELKARLARGEADLNASRRDLGETKALADSYLETLRSRDWRGGFNQNLFREWDAKIDAAQSGRSTLQAECERLEARVASLNAKLAEQDEKIANLNDSKASDATALAQRAQETQEVQRARDELAARLESLQAERTRLEGELAASGRELVEARAQGAGEAKRLTEQLAAADGRHRELSAQLEQLRAEMRTKDEEMTVLMAHLNEARRPVAVIEAEVKRLSDELALKTASIDRLTEDNRELRANLERTRGALEERELLIRRLERSASANANVLGRLQTSIEKLGTVPAPAPGPTAQDYTAELVRTDGGRHLTFPLGRRTRIGRATGCDLQIDSQSVSRNHALILKGPRELIVEDLNSTNGVLLNGKKVSRHLMKDGDVLTVGEIQFRCVFKPPAAAPGEGALDAAQAAVGVSAPGASTQAATAKASGPRPAESQAPDPTTAAPV
jgi:chromosome segregation ATPase